MIFPRRGRRGSEAFRPRYSIPRRGSTSCHGGPRGSSLQANVGHGGVARGVVHSKVHVMLNRMDYPQPNGNVEHDGVVRGVVHSSNGGPHGFFPQHAYIVGALWGSPPSMHMWGRGVVVRGVVHSSKGGPHGFFP